MSVVKLKFLLQPKLWLQQKLVLITRSVNVVAFLYATMALSLLVASLRGFGRLDAAPDRHGRERSSAGNIE